MPIRRKSSVDLGAVLRTLKSVRGLYARAPEAVIVYHERGKLDCNLAALRIFGYRRKADLLAVPRGGTSPRRQPDGRTSAAAARHYHALAFRHGYVKFDWVHIRPDGREFPAEVVLATFQLDGHTLIRSAVRDMTAERRIEAARAASEARFRNLAESHPVPLAVTAAAEDRFLYVSEAVAKLFGVPRSRLLGMRPSQFWVEASARKHGREAIERAGSVDNFRTRMRRGDGSEYWAEVSGRMIEFDGVPAIAASIRDLTDAVAAESALRESEERFRQIAELHPVPMVINDRLFSRYLYVSPAAARMLRTTPEAMMETSPVSFWDDPKDMHRAGRLLFERDGLDDYEARVRRSDGEELWLAATIRPIDYRGAPAWLNALVDVTARKHMERALRDSEERFRAIAESSPVAMAVHSIQNPRLLYANAAFGTLYRSTCEELLRHPMADLWVDQADRSRLRQMLSQGVQVDELVARHRRADGSEFWVAVSTRPMVYEGEPCWISTVRDLTAQHAAEAALRESEERFRQIAELHPVPMAITDNEFRRYLYVSPAAARLLQTTPEAMLAASPAQFWADPDEMRRAGEHLQRHGGMDDYEAQVRRSDGEELSISATVRPVEYRGAPAWLNALVDVTARKRMESALRDSERRFRELLEQHPSPMVVTSGTEDRILYVSKAGERLLGMPADEILAKPASWFWADLADRERVRQAVLDGGVIDELEVRLRRAGGSEYWASLSGRVFEYDGKPALFMTGRDLTREKETDAEIERQRGALEQSAKMAAMGSLLASVSHELNNPLAVVMAQAELLKEVAGGTAMADRADTIHAAAERCARIVRTFLALARQKPPTARAFDLNEVVRSAVELLGYGLKSAGVAVRLDLAKDLQPIYGDADQMAQVLSNLLINAQQAMQQHTGPRRLVVATRRAGSGKRVRLRVTDSGPGVPRELRARIFEPFFTTKPVGTGTGIGLALCHNIIAAHGGTITVEDAPGGGTRFLIVLPVRPTEVTLAAAPAAKATSIRAQAILVVDDEPQLLATMADVLAPLAGRIDRAANGREAMKLIERNAYDAVLSDLRMPDMDGPALHAAIGVKRPDLLKRMVFITGDSLGIGVEQFLEQCGAPVLEKPFSAEDLRRAVSQVLGSNR